MLFCASCLRWGVSGYAALLIFGAGIGVVFTVQAELGLLFVWEGLGKIFAGEKVRRHGGFVPPV